MLDDHRAGLRPIEDEPDRYEPARVERRRRLDEVGKRHDERLRDQLVQIREPLRVAPRPPIDARLERAPRDAEPAEREPRHLAVGILLAGAVMVAVPDAWLERYLGGDALLSLLVVAVLGREKVETELGVFDALKVQPRMHDPSSTADRNEGKKLFLWFSDDARRLPVMARSILPIGSVTARLTRVSGEAPSPPAPPEPPSPAR